MQDSTAYEKFTSFSPKQYFGLLDLFYNFYLGHNKNILSYNWEDLRRFFSWFGSFLLSQIRGIKWENKTQVESFKQQEFSLNEFTEQMALTSFLLVIFAVNKV